MANGPLQERYGGTVIAHARDPEQFRPATPEEKRAARQHFGVPQEAKVVLFFGTPRRHKGLLTLAEGVAELPEHLQPVLVVAGGFASEDADLQQDLHARLPTQRLVLLGNQPFEQAAQVLALADLVVLLSEGEVAAFQSPAKLSDALGMGLPVLISKTPPNLPLIHSNYAQVADEKKLPRQIEELLNHCMLHNLCSDLRLFFMTNFAFAAVSPNLRKACIKALARTKAGKKSAEPWNIINSLS